jgi:hypothetical protein
MMSDIEKVIWAMALAAWIVIAFRFGQALWIKAKSRKRP